MSQTTKIKPKDILSILDLAFEARKTGGKFSPLFRGDAGIGKSEICQLWVKQQQKRNPKFFFLDLRMAYMEAPDVVGLPRICSETKRTIHVLPEFWPTEGEGLILFEEPNRANVSVKNTMMQVLTDWKIHNHTLPPMTLLAGCINEGSLYETDAMDLALMNRFVPYDVGYDFPTFVEYIQKHNWNPMVVAWVKSGGWVFKSAEELGTEGRYISPRTIAQLNTAMNSGLEDRMDIFFSTVSSILGNAVGREFHKFITGNRPILAQDFIDDKKEALKRLEKFCNGKDYKGDIVNILLDSLGDNFMKHPEINLDVICEVSLIIPKDQVHELLERCVQKSNLKLADFIKHEPKLETAIKKSLQAKKEEK